MFRSGPDDIVHTHGVALARRRRKRRERDRRTDIGCESATPGIEKCKIEGLQRINSGQHVLKMCFNGTLHLRGSVREATGHIVGKPGAEIGTEVIPVCSKSNGRLQPSQLVTGVIAAAFEDNTMHAAPDVRRHRCKHAQRIRELDLTTTTRLCNAKYIEDRGIKHITSDHRIVARRLIRCGLLHEVANAHDVGGLCGDHVRHAVQRQHLLRHAHKGNHASTELLADLDHAGQEWVARIDEVVTEKHGKRLITHVICGLQHGMPETAWLTLPDVVDVCEFRRPPDLIEPLGVMTLLQRLLDFICAIEVVFEGTLGAAGDEQNVREACGSSLFHYVLNRGSIDDGQHLLRRRLRRRQESRSKTSSRDDRFAHHAPTLCAARRVRLDSDVSSNRELRARLRAERAAVTTPHDARAVALADRVMAHECLRALPHGSWIACYTSYADEPPTRELLRRLCDAGFEVVVPSVHGQNLHWHDVTGEVDDPKVWTRDSLGIPVPHTPEIATSAHELLALGVRVVITPGLGMERSGARIGQGGGYYDRLFAQMPLHRDGGPFRLGLTHPGGLLPDGTIVVAEHDQPLDDVIEA